MTRTSGTSHSSSNSGASHSTTGSHDETGSSGATTSKTKNDNTDNTDPNTPSADQTKRTDGKTNGGKPGDKDANDKEGKGVDVSDGSTPPQAGTAARDVYDAKKRLVDEGNAAKMTAEQQLNATLAEIKQWAKDHEIDNDQ